MRAWPLGLGRFILSIFLFGVFWTQPTLATPPAQQNRDFTISVDVELVTLPVSVLDRDGHPVFGLEKENFRVFEDGVEQEIERFVQEDVPVSIGLAIDSSGSMNNKRQSVSSAALVFVRESNPDDETFIVTFNDEVFLEQDFTRSIGNLTDALDNIQPRGETAVNDAIYLALEHVEEEGRMDKKAILIISDGEDNASAYGHNAIMERLRQSDVTVYAIGILEQNDESGGLFRKSRSEIARDALEEITEATGGQAFFPKSVDEVEELCRRIARDLRSHYTIGYRPSNKAFDGMWRNIKVEVDPPRGFPRISVRTKEGYFAPGEPPQTP